MRRLAAEESDGFSCADGDTHHRSSGAIDPAGEVDRDNRSAVGVDRLDHIVRVAFHRPVETGTEQGIDDQRRFPDRLRVERQHRVFPPLGRGRGIPLEPLAITEQDDRHLSSVRRQFGGRNEAVSAVVAGARHHNHRTLRDELHRGLCHRLACAQHQRKSRRSSSHS